MSDSSGCNDFENFALFSLVCETATHAGGWFSHCKSKRPPAALFKNGPKKTPYYITPKLVSAADPFLSAPA